MSTRAQLLALHDELRRLKAAGQRSVAVGEESLEMLRAAVSAVHAVETPEPAGAAAVVAVAEKEPSRAFGPEPTAAGSPAGSNPPRPAVPPRPAAPSSLAPIPSTPPVVTLPAGDKAARWSALKELVLNDPVCRAHVRPGKKVVLGVGSLEADIFFCGEAPGAEEEEQGEPFVGPAGQLLTRMIQGMGLQREQVYIGNIMNWRPEMEVGAGGVQFGNRPPTPEEMNYCLPYLRAQLDVVRPKVIVALGKTAAEGLLGFGTFKSVGEIRGRWRDFAGVPLIVTYHPSYILRNQTNSSKRAIWEDLLKVMERALLPVTEKQKGYFL